METSLNLRFRIARCLWIFTTCTYSICAGDAIGQSSGWEWAQSLGGTETSALASSTHIVVEQNGGSVYTTGTYSGTVDFNPGSGVNNLNGFGIFLSKFDSNGNFLWAKALHGSGTSTALVLDPTGRGDIYVTGGLTGTIDFDPGTGSFYLASNGNSDVFVAKYDLSGNFIWAISFGGLQDEVGKFIAFDPYGSGSIYTTGSFNSTIDFDPGPGVFEMTSASWPYYYNDMFISKLDLDGHFVWAKSIGSNNSSTLGQSVAVSVADGNVVIAGNFYGIVDFDPGAGTYLMNSFVATDAFVCCLSRDGNFIWVSQLGGTTGYCTGLRTVIDAHAQVYITGEFTGTIDFDPGAGVYNLTSNGALDFYISKLDSGGNFIWAKSIGGSQDDKAPAFVVDPEKIYITGEFEGSMDVDPGAGVYSLSAVGLYDIFNLKWDTDGNFIWAYSIGGPNADGGFSIAVDTVYGSVFTTGYYSGFVDFDPGADTVEVNGQGMYISKVDETSDLLWVKSIVGSEEIGSEIFPARTKSIAVNPVSGEVFTLGSYRGDLDFDPGPDTFLVEGDGLFISKTDAAGNFEWVKLIPEVDSLFPSSIVISHDRGAIWVTGFFYGTVDFDPGPDSFNLSGFSPYYLSVFVLKLDLGGQFIWAMALVGDEFYGSSAVGLDIAIDNAGNYYLSGEFYNGPMDFDPGPDVYYLDTQFCSGFICKFNSSGDFIWANSMGGWGCALNVKVAADPVNEQVFATGIYQGECQFGNIASYSTYPEDDWDLFICSIDSLGQYLWAKGFGCTQLDDWSDAITIDHEGNVYTTGTFRLTADFDPGAVEMNLISAGGTDVFVVVLDNTGNLVWAKRWGGAGNDSPASIVVEGMQHAVYTTGNFIGTVDFDPGADIFNVGAPGPSDVFISKLDAYGNLLWAGKLGGSEHDGGACIGLDYMNHLYLSGVFSSPYMTVGSTTLLNPASSNSPDIFLAKLNACSGSVTVNSDKGFGSLRDVIYCVDPGSTIDFLLPSMSQINLTSGEILINKDLTISGPGVLDLSISGSNSSRIFNLLPQNNLSLQNLALKNAVSNTDGGAILITGNLSLTNVLFENNFQNGIPKALTLTSPGSLTINGIVETKE